MSKFIHRDCTEEATALFSSFVERHGFAYEVDTDAPVEVLWHIPAQERLSLPLTLGLQNWDELNFGVEDFWSYFFPFDAVASEFEKILDQWVTGDARVAVVGRRARTLQIRDGEGWKSVYWADQFPLFQKLFGIQRRVWATVENDPDYSNSTMT